jgi:transcriptional regulator with XRE-family HTH domain
MLKEGKVSVNVEQISLAKDRHNLNPAWLWGMSEHRELPAPELGMPAGYIEESSSDGYGEAVSYTSDRVGKVIDDMLEKHKVKRTEYAERELKMTPRNLQRILKGEVSPHFVTVAKIAEDLGEPLDAFRQKPLPRGHFLQLLKEREERIIEQSRTLAEQGETISALQRAVFKLSAA